MIRIEPVDTGRSDESVLRRLHAYYEPLDREELPEDDPVPFERWLLDRRSTRRDERVMRWVAFDGVEIVGAAVTWANLENNLNAGYVRVSTTPTRRGEGIGRALLRPAFDDLETQGRKLVDTYVINGRSEAELCQRAGWKMAYREKRSRLSMGTLDVGLMRSWIERADERAGDYQLLLLETPFADEHIEPWCQLQFLMNTEPREDLEMEDEVLTPEIWRDLQARTAEAKRKLYSVVAVHRPSGLWVGSSSIMTDDLQAAQAWQWETVTHPDHRNRGLGRWMKATNVLRVRDAVPGMERVDTFNAGSNEPMLNINLTMGFSPILVMDTWQGDLESARKRLGA